MTSVDGAAPIWGSIITRELVSGWSDDEVERLVADLNEIVMLTYRDHEARRADG